jgi:hypothetical protein
MGAEVFEVGLLKPDAANEPHMLLRTWDVPTLLRSVSWLRHQNATGRHIFIRPHGEHRLTLLDDLVPEKVSRLSKEGFEPAAVVQTSPGNYQAWLKHSGWLPRETGTAVAKLLAERLGADPSSADWRHFGRLAGFTNRKLKYAKDGGLFPFVLLESASGAVYSKALEIVAEAEANLYHEQVRHWPTSHLDPNRFRTIDDFRRDPRYGGDGNRIDMAYTLYAVSHGMPEIQIIAQLKSRDLSHKGSEQRQADYVTRTLQKAVARITGYGELGRG